MWAEWDTGQPIPLRAHHGLCIQHFTGQGYDSAFTENMTRVVAHLQAQPEQEILLCTTLDLLCAPCPNNHGGVCDSQDKVEQYDQRCLTLCGLQPGQRLPWSAFRDRVARMIIQPHALAQVCTQCSWLSLCLEVDAAASCAPGCGRAERTK